MAHLFRSLAVRLRTIRVIGGLFFGSEAAAALYRGLALPYCICVYTEVSLTSWGDRICMWFASICTYAYVVLLK